ncbi:MAG TPA: hypothetical protein PLA31_07450 [Clostridia bacterium]|nr:hypothetical protein [Clostridia bacterium]
MERIQKCTVFLVILLCSVTMAAGQLWATEPSAGETDGTMTVGGHTFQMPSSRFDSEYSSAFRDALDNARTRFSEMPLSFVGSRITQSTEVNPGGIFQQVTIGGSSQRVPVVGATGDISNPTAGQTFSVGGRLMQYQAAQGTQPAGWIDITDKGARVTGISCDVRIGTATVSVPVVDSRPTTAPGEGDPNRVIFRGMVYEYQPGTGGAAGRWENISYERVPAASVAAGSYEQTIMVGGEEVQAGLAAQVPATHGSEYVVVGSQVYRWSATSNKYEVVQTGDGEGANPRIVSGSVTATVQLPGGSEATDVPVVSQVPAATGFDDGDMCVVQDGNRTSVYIFDEEAGSWQRSIATFTVGAQIDRDTMSADVTIDGVEHEDVPVVTHLPAQHTQGQDTVVIRDILGRESVYNWDADSNSWMRVAAAAEMGNVYQQFSVDLPGGTVTGRAQVVTSTDEIARPVHGQIVAVVDAAGEVQGLYRYDRNQWKLVHEFEAEEGSDTGTGGSGAGAGAGAGTGAGTGAGPGTTPLAEPNLTPEQLGRRIAMGRHIQGQGREIISMDRYANYIIISINVDGGTNDVRIYQKLDEPTADVFFSGSLASQYTSQQDVTVVSTLPSNPATGQTMVIYKYNLYVWKDNAWKPIVMA